MQGGTFAETRKVVCRTLTNVVRSSQLGAEIDPKTFFMMLNANYPVLYRAGLIDLSPLWEALHSGHRREQLFALFLEFAAATEELGIPVSLPSDVKQLTAEERQIYRERFGAEGTPLPLDVAFVEEIGAEAVDAPAPSLVLATGDLKPFIPDDLRRQLIQLVVDCVKAAPVGARVDRAQLAYLVDNNFTDLCDGVRFDFEPILGGLRQLEGFTDADVYVGLVRVRAGLKELGIELSHAPLSVTPELGERLLEEAKKRDSIAAQETTPRSPPAIARAVAEPQTAPNEDDAKLSGRERRLRRWGLLGVSSKTLRRIRIAVGMVLIISMGTFAWLTRPDRPLELAKFGQAVPLKEATLFQGTFQGVLDDDKWWALPVDQRKAKFEAFEALLRAEGLVNNSQVRDGQRRLVMTGAVGKLKGARFFLEGDREGNLPPSSPPTAPAKPGS